MRLIINCRTKTRSPVELNCCSLVAGPDVCIDLDDSQSTDTHWSWWCNHILKQTIIIDQIKCNICHVTQRKLFTQLLLQYKQTITSSVVMTSCTKTLSTLRHHEFPHVENDSVSPDDPKDLTLQFYKMLLSYLLTTSILLQKICLSNLMYSLFTLNIYVTCVFTRRINFAELFNNVKHLH